MHHGNLQTRGRPGRQGQKKLDESGKNRKLFTKYNLGAENTISLGEYNHLLVATGAIRLAIAFKTWGHGFIYHLQQSTPNIFQEQKHFSVAAPE